MRAKKAKQLKKSIYGDKSTKEERKYMRTKEGQIIEMGDRGKYQLLKKMYKKFPAVKNSFRLG